MASKVAVTFESEGIIIPFDRLLCLRKLPTSVRGSAKYRAIAASIREVGLIEPLIVYPHVDQPGYFLLLDGVIRLDILQSMGESKVFCLKATEDEAFTYNHKVNQMSAIQAHFMIMKAIDNGVPEDRIAATLNVDAAAIRRQRNLLTGICEEAVDLLRDKRASPAALRELKRVVAMRQIEMAELMIAAHNYTASYAKCLYLATPDDQKVDAEKPDDGHGVTPEEVARIEREMNSLRHDFKLIEETHGENVLNLVLAVGFLKSILANSKVGRFLGERYPEILKEFKSLIEAPDLDASATNGIA